MKTGFSEAIVILLVSSKVCLANQICSNNSCNPTETVHIFTMDIAMDGTEIHLAWTFNSSEMVYGFVGLILSEENTTLYQSPVLNSNERKMTINYELTNSRSLVCLQAMLNQSEIMVQKCEIIEVSDLKIIVGILAGTIFIIPCMIALGFIVFKDYQVRKLEKIALLTEEEQNKLLGSKSKDQLNDASEKSCGSIVEVINEDHVTTKETHDGHVTTEEQGEDNSGFVTDSSVSLDGVKHVKPHNIGDNMKTKAITVENNESEDLRVELDGTNYKKAVTLKVDIDLARKMAETDTEYNAHL